MNKEEKEAINNLRFYSTNVGFSKYDGTTCVLRAKDVQTVLNLIGKQYAELNSLKEIEKSHKEENGKLRVEFEKVYEDNLTLAHELEQEKEKNKELEDKQIWNKGRIEELKNELQLEKEKYKRLQNTEAFSEYYISKDKLKFVLSKLNISDIEPWSTYKIDGQILFDLQELL